MQVGAPVAIVDDDEAIRKSLSSLIRSAGYTADLYETAETFLATADLGAVRFVISDVQMAGMSGLDLLARLRELKPSLPVLMMTAFPDQSLRDRAERLGVRAFLGKPFDADEVLAHVEDVMSGLSP